MHCLYNRRRWCERDVHVTRDQWRVKIHTLNICQVVTHKLLLHTHKTRNVFLSLPFSWVLMIQNPLKLRRCLNCSRTRREGFSSKAAECTPESGNSVTQRDAPGKKEIGPRAILFFLCRYGIRKTPKQPDCTWEYDLLFCDTNEARAATFDLFLLTTLFPPSLPKLHFFDEGLW